MKGTEQDAPSFQLPYSEKQRKYLWLVYYRQKEFFSANTAYASSLSQLKIDADITIENKINTLKLEATGRQFRATIRSSQGQLISINHEGYVQ
jgi:hypothetical protein